MKKKKPHKEFFKITQEDKVTKNFMLWGLCPYVTHYILEYFFVGMKNGSVTALIAALIISINFVYIVWKAYVYIKNYSKYILEELKEDEPI